MKTSNISIFNDGDVPDHMIEEVTAVVRKLIDEVSELIAKHSPNVVLSAFNRFHAALILELVVDDPKQIEKALISCSNGLIENVRGMCKYDLFEEYKEH